jgi:hypothetical protein
MTRRRRRNIGRLEEDGSQPNEHVILEPNNSEQPDAVNEASTGDGEPTEKLNIPHPDPIIPVFGSSTKKTEKKNENTTVIESDEDNRSESEYPDDAYFGPRTRDKPEIDEDHLAHVDISNRRGNYLLSVGLPSSGKTVLQSFTTYSMSVFGRLNVTLDNKEIDGKLNYEAQRLQTLWLEEWKKGNFPAGTPLAESEIRELRLDIENLENKKQKFNFSFLEISGESFKEVVPTEVSDPKLFERINSFITNNKIKMNIAFVLKTDETPGEPTNDALFTNFVTFLKNNLPDNFDKKVGLILVIPNPKAVFGEENWKRMRSPKSSDRKFYSKLVRSYIFENFPATYVAYDRWNSKKRNITVFHIGDEEQGKLKNADHADAQSFIKLNYRLFTDKMLEPKKSLLQWLFGAP